MLYSLNEKHNSKQNASATRDFEVVIPKYDFKSPAKIVGEKIEIETYIIQSNQNKHQKIIVQNLR